MASEGPNSPGTIIGDMVGSHLWSNPENAGASDDTYATVSVAGADSEALQATDFGFSIPVDATVDGIVCEVEGKESTGADRLDDLAVRIIKGGVVGSTDRSNASFWAFSDTYRSYGGTTDKWGETWEPADINASDFGFSISVHGFFGGGSSACAVDHIRITVHYTEAGGGGNRRRRMIMTRKS